MGRVSAGDEIAGQYRLVQQLGSGGQGEVWEATSLRVSTRVALRRVRLEEDGARRAIQEAEKLARVRHTHVVTVYGVVADGEDHWIVMEYVAGEPLGRLGTITVEEAAIYGAQLADGLAALHAQDLLHRDVTPSNVIVADGTATLIDFGIAHSVADADALTSGGRVTGTPGYLAPEMLDPETQYRRPADVFGLGATLYRALEGTTPFGEGSDAQLFARTEWDDVRPPRRAGAMAGVLMRMLDKNPRQRPTLETVRDELNLLVAVAARGVALAGTSARVGTMPLGVRAFYLLAEMLTSQDVRPTKEAVPKGRWSTFVDGIALALATGFWPAARQRRPPPMERLVLRLNNSYGQLGPPPTTWAPYDRRAPNGGSVS